MLPEQTPRLRFLDIRGTPHDVGVALGRFGARAVRDVLMPSRAWREVTSRSAAADVSAMATLVRERFPRYWQELRGLAEGLELPFDDVFLWNCRGDVWPTAPGGCTTVHMPGPPHVVAHNEDGEPRLAGHCAVARIASDGGAVFTAFVYPGSLPGHTFAATADGLVQTVNNIRPLRGGRGVPRMILTRATLDCDGLDAAVSLIRAHDRGGAFHLTLARAGDDRLLSVEFSADAVSVMEVDVCGVHANHFVHPAMTAVPQRVTGSSGQRQRRGADLAAAAAGGGRGEADALKLLWDTGCSDFPIHRTDPGDPDNENTLATAVFRIGRDGLRWAVYDRPGASPCFDMGRGLEPAAV